MGSPERQAVIAYQSVGQLGQCGPAVAGTPFEAYRVELGGRHRGGDQFDRPRRVAEHRKHERLQVILRVDDVAEGRVVDSRTDRLRLTKRLAADGARVLDRDRIALLRHDAAALHEPVTESDVAEL